jgi:hypothetical protein
MVRRRLPAATARVKPLTKKAAWCLPRSWIVGALLLHLLPFLSRPALIGGDEPHYALMAYSIATDGDFSLADDYAEVAGGARAAGRMRAGQDLDRHLLTVSGRTWFAHPLGLPVLVAPFVALQQLVAPGSAPDLLLGFLTLAVTFSALLSGVWLLGRFTVPVRRGALVALGVYFSSSLWFYSRTFTTEPYIWSFAVLSLACLEAERLAWASAFLALSLAMKETAIVIVGPILLASLLILGPRRAWRLFVGPAIFGGLFVVKNLALGAPPFATFQPYQFASSAAGLVGLLFDGERGLLWFSPLLLLGMVGWRRAFVERPGRVIATAGAGILLAYYLVTALWVDWRGGSGYGPRLLVPVLPVLAIPLLSLVTARASRLLQGLLIGGFVSGFVVNWCAALRPVEAFWSASVFDLVVGHPIAAAFGVALALGAALRAARIGLFAAPLASAPG